MLFLLISDRILDGQMNSKRIEYERNTEIGSFHRKNGIALNAIIGCLNISGIINYIVITTTKNVPSLLAIKKFHRYFGVFLYIWFKI